MSIEDIKEKILTGYYKSHNEGKKFLDYDLENLLLELESVRKNQDKKIKNIRKKLFTMDKHGKV